MIPFSDITLHVCCVSLILTVHSTLSQALTLITPKLNHPPTHLQTQSPTPSHLYCLAHLSTIHTTTGSLNATTINVDTHNVLHTAIITVTGSKYQGGTLLHTIASNGNNPRNNSGNSSANNESYTITPTSTAITVPPYVHQYDRHEFVAQKIRQGLEKLYWDGPPFY